MNQTRGTVNTAGNGCGFCIETRELMCSMMIMVGSLSVEDEEASGAKKNKIQSKLSLRPLL